MRARARPGLPPLGDVLFAVAVTALSLPLLWVPMPAELSLPGYEGPSATGVLLSISMTLPLAWRLRHPVAVLLWIGTATAVAAVWPVPFVGLGLLVALYTVAATRPRRDALVALGGVMGLLLVTMAVTDALQHLPGNLVVFSAAWLFGDWRRLQAARAAELRRRAHEAGRAQQERTQLALAHERERIAGEVRDVLAHGVAAMLTQARAAARTLPDAPDQAAGALERVEAAGTTSIAELRRLVRLLRSSERGPRAHVVAEAGESDGRSATPSRSAASRVRHVVADRLRRVRARIEALPHVLQDLVLVVVVLALELPLQWQQSLEAGPAAGFEGASPTSVALLVALVGLLAGRRRWPQAVLAGALALSLAVLLLAVPAQLFAPLIALYTVGAHCPRRRSMAWLGLTVSITVAVLLAEGFPALVPGQLATLGVVWLLGDWQRVRRAYLDQLEQRAASLEQARAREEELAVAAERAGIARELHDVVAQGLGVMVVQARAARALSSRDSARAAAALDHVIVAGLDSLQWLRDVVDVLGRQSDDYAPQPGLEDLDELVESLAAAGLTVVVRSVGEERGLAHGVSLSAYRIVQESLTNVLKHAGTDRAEVTLHHGEALEIVVADDGRGPRLGGQQQAPGSGHGVIGMTERARLVGGELSTGPRAGGGFVVRARLPLDEAPQVYEGSAS